MNIRHVITACLLSSVVLTACSSDDDPVTETLTDTPGAGETSMPAPGVDPGTGPQALTQYNGNYVYSCNSAGPDESDIVEISIQDGVMFSTISDYSDANCTTLASTVSFTSSMAYPGGTAETPRGLADYLDINVESFSINGVPATPEQMAGLDAEGVFDVFYIVILLEGNNLYFGDTDVNDGTTPGTRATTLEDVAAVRL